ncbi:MAG TPA: four helix bundle protein [Lentisphaeria bacterium]|nr:MAG: four helix bundle protein [Lentisphaerae bacterium GWF2_38_69]HBM17063.1 four helix bundle protein [Lentisphaeria bacterium]
MTQDELKTRTKEFAIRIINLCAALPDNAIGRTIRNQLIRSGCSVGANYRASCRARSKAEFIAKLGIVIEESDESSFWLELIIEAKVMKKELVAPLLAESNELTAIFAKAVISSKNKSSIINHKS